MSSPPVSGGTFWDVYSALLTSFRAAPDNPNLEREFYLANLGADDEMELIQGLRALRNGDNIVGDAVSLVGQDGIGFLGQEDVREYGDFTDEEGEFTDEGSKFTEEEGEFTEVDNELKELK